MDDQKPEAIAPAPAVEAPVAPAIAPEVKPAEAVAAEPAEPQRGWGAAFREKASALRENRMALLAASVVFAAGFGVVAGALASSAYSASPPAPTVKVATAGDIKPLADMVAQLKAEISALKTASDTASRNANAQFGKLSERFDKAQSEPSARLARMAETLDKLEQKVASTAIAKDVTGSVTARAPEPPKPQVIDGWRLRSVYDGAALLQGRGGMIEVEPGDVVPNGGGRVERIARQDGRWVVTTSKGIIVSVR